MVMSKYSKITRYTFIIISSFIVLIRGLFSYDRTCLTIICTTLSGKMHINADFKGGLWFQWETRFSTPTAPSPMKRLKWNLSHVITSWRRRPMQIFTFRPFPFAPGKGVKYNDFWSYVPFLPVLSRNRLAPTRVDRFSRSMSQMTSFRPRRCILGLDL